MLLQDQLPRNLPSAKDLPDSDDTPVDNELQDLVPHVLKEILALVWGERMDWFFGVDMGIYYNPNNPTIPIIPDGFLSIGVPRIIDESLRLSYVLWEEGKMPLMVLEVVSQKRRGEYTEKKQEYSQMGILYYVIYNPLRKRKARLEVYQLIESEYQLLEGEIVWLEAIGLGIGKERGVYQGIEREWLYWYNKEGKRYLTPEETIQFKEQIALNERQEKLQERQAKLEAEKRELQERQAKLEAEKRELQERQAKLEAEKRAQKLAEKLKSFGVDIDEL